MSDRPQFLFLTSQVGAERAVKGELARRWPAFRPAFSRPGFLTVKLPEDHRLVADFDLESVFARAYGFCLGKVTGAELAELARAAWELYGGRPFRRIHVWPRDAAAPRDGGFEPSITPAAIQARQALLEHCPRPEMLASGAADWRQAAQRGEFVLDCVLVEPDEWWIGYHRVRSVPSGFPGGMMTLDLPPHAVSGAWLKMEEALRWSRLPIREAARCAELGSAPGGSSQALLDRGLTVVGVDAAAMHPTVLAHPNFTHIRRRARAAPRREFRKIRWLTADMNATPDYTLDVVEGVVTHREVHVRGLLLTMKLTRWSLADGVPEFLARVRGWGYNIVGARQLMHNRREFCLFGLQKPFRK